MLKVKWVLFHKGPTGCGENLIEAEVLDMDTEILEEVNSNLNQYKNRNNKVDCGLIHGFAQFQTCIMATMHLNSLLLDPFPSPCIPHIFSGTFLYNFCKELQENRNPDELIYELLSKDSNLPQIYKCFFDAVCNALCPAAFINKYFRRLDIIMIKKTSKTEENSVLSVIDRFLYCMCLDIVKDLYRVRFEITSLPSGYCILSESL